MTHNVKHFMETSPKLISPDATLREAAQMMREADCGFLPVGSNDQPQGIITDRDIVIRAIAEGKDPTKETVVNYMTRDVCSCKEDETLDAAADKMKKSNVSRLVIVDNNGRVTGVLSFGKILRANERSKAIDEVVECAKAA